MDFETYDRLVRKAYAGVTTKAEWDSLLAELCLVLHVEQASLLLSARSEIPTYVMHDFNVDPRFMADYESYYCSVDPGKPFVSMISTGDWYVDDEWLGKTEKAKSEFYQDFLRPYGFTANLCTPLANDSKILAGLSVQCTADQHDLRSNLAVDGLKPFLAHFSKAVELHFQFDKLLEQISFGKELADKIHSAVMVVSSSEEIVYANSRAEQFFCLSRSASSKKITPNVHGNSVHTAVRNLFCADRKTITRISHCENANTRELFLIGLPIARDHSLASEAFESYGVFVLHDPYQTKTAGAHLLREIYGLSMAEERLITRWAEKKSLSSAAVELNVSIDTVRTQIKSIFAKTGCKGQADLADLLCKLGAIT